jgi:class 3 adenylate cyclase
VQQCPWRHPERRCVGGDATHHRRPASGRVAATGRTPIRPSQAHAAAARLLKTLLFTDIVSSTEHAVRLGDHEWCARLGAHNVVMRAQIRRFGGTELGTAGDSFFVSFDSPSAAVRCAAAMIDAMSSLELELRAGVHTGEVERRSDRFAGIAIHVAARVAAYATAGEVLVSGAVVPLVQGSGIDFADRGDQQLRGLPGLWHLFAVVTARQ